MNLSLYTVFYSHFILEYCVCIFSLYKLCLCILLVSYGMCKSNLLFQVFFYYISNYLHSCLLRYIFFRFNMISNPDYVFVLFFLMLLFHCSISLLTLSHPFCFSISLSFLHPKERQREKEKEERSGCFLLTLGCSEQSFQHLCVNVAKTSCHLYYIIILTRP